MSSRVNFTYLIAICCILVSACGDLSDTCIKNKQCKICYSEEENTRSAADLMLEYLPKSYPNLETSFRIHQNENDLFDYTILVELNTALDRDKQETFLRKMANELSVNCFSKKKLRLVAVSDIDATTKGNVSVISQ